MANAKTYRIDPNVLLATAQAGTAQSPADRTAAFYAKLFAAANNDSPAYEVIDTTATSLAVDLYETQLNISGTMTATLPDGTFIGQKKLVRVMGAAASPALTLTVTTPETATGFACASTWFFDTLGQEVEFVWTENSKWRANYVKRAGGIADNVVIGTTVLTGKNMWKRYCCSVTGTVSSTTTKGLPNGSAIGERCILTNSTVGGTPIGDIAGVFTGMNGTAYTDIGAIGVASSTTVTGDFAELEWTGSSWAVVNMSGVTLS